MEQTSSYYLVIPGYIRSDLSLSTQAKLLFGEIGAKCNLTGYCWATNQFFCDALGYKERSIQGFLKELSERKYIRIEIENNTDRKIYIMAPTDTPQEAAPPPPKKRTPTPAKKRAGAPAADCVQNNLSFTTHTDYSNTVTSEEVTGAQVPPVAEEPEPKRTADSPKEKTTYQKFIDIYDKWYKKFNNGVPPNYANGNGNAAKSLIWYLRSVVKSKALADGQGKLTEAQEDEQILKSWKYILHNWELLDAFTQARTRLVDINSSIQNIITRIKSVQDGKAKQQSAAAGPTADGVQSELHKRFGQGESVHDQ